MGKSAEAQIPHMRVHDLWDLCLVSKRDHGTFVLFNVEIDVLVSAGDIRHRK